jgi:hypothetical protein
MMNQLSSIVTPSLFDSTVYGDGENFHAMPNSRPNPTQVREQFRLLMLTVPASATKPLVLMRKPSTTPVRPAPILRGLSEIIQFPQSQRPAYQSGTSGGMGSRWALRGRR